MATIGVERYKHDYLPPGAEAPIIASFWDTSGQERYHSITRSFYRKANGVLLVFDVTNPKSFRNVENWLAEIS